jgi:hypothetical protein
MDCQLRKTAGTLATIPAMMARTAAAPAAAMAAAMMTLARPPVQAPQDLRDLLVVVHRIFRRCASSW